jgi:membrane associated rhomboid family serine protease
LDNVHDAGARVGYNLTHDPRRWFKGIVLSSVAFAGIGAVVSALPLQRATPLQDGLIVGIASFAFELLFAALVLGTLAALVLLPLAALFGALGAGAGWLISSAAHDSASRINQIAIQSAIVGAGVGCLVGLVVALRRRRRKR